MFVAPGALAEPMAHEICIKATSDLSRENSKSWRRKMKKTNKERDKKKKEKKILRSDLEHSCSAIAVQIRLE